MSPAHPKTAVTLVGILALSTPANAQLLARQLATDHLPGTNSTANAAVAADFDRDGAVDLLLGTRSPTSGAAQLFFNRGDGRFAQRGGTLQPPTNDIEPLAAADLNGDGWIDVLTKEPDPFFSFHHKLGFLINRQGRLGTVVPVAAGQVATRDVAIGDLDADGDLDILLAAGGGLQWLRNDGDLRFTARPLARPAHGSDVGQVALGDVDGDADLDFVAAAGGHPPAVFVNDGAGGFAEDSGAVTLTAATQPTGVILVDVNRDGALDLLSLDFDTTLTLNDGAGRFLASATTVLASLPTVPSSPGYATAVTPDFDADGDPDLVLSSGPNEPLVLLQNDGSGAFEDRSASWLVGKPAGRLDLAADFDGDGDDDVLAGVTQARAKLLLSNGQDRLEDATHAQTPRFETSGAAFYAIDLELDGDLDLLRASTELAVLRNNGGGAFEDVTATWLPAGASGTPMGIGDFDGDGDPDVLLRTATDMQVLTNDGAQLQAAILAGIAPLRAAAVGDIGGSGFTDVVGVGPTGLVYLLGTPQGLQDISILVGSARSPADVALGDLDGDGDLDLVVSVRAGSTTPNQILENVGVALLRTSLGAGLPAFGGPTAIGDFDGDGDLDLVIGDNANRILLNDGRGRFTPGGSSPWIGAPSTMFAADYDEDGDVDIIQSPLRGAATGTALLVNDGNAHFVDAAAELLEPIAQAVIREARDFDGDGDVDLLLSENTPADDAVHVNLRRQLRTPDLARLGREFRFELFARPGFAAQSCIGVTFVASRLMPRPIAVPTFGRLALDLTTALTLPAVPIPAPAGRAEFATRLPRAPALLGATLYAQSLVIGTATPAGVHELTNVVADTIGR
ncbi:MAG: VCBS repeat-containing protein [Planctomycetota bacterium]